MLRHIMGGIAGWIIGALPLIAVNFATYLGYYFDNPILIGAVALLAGLLLGGIASGYIGGGRETADAVGGAAGAGISGSIAALLYAVTIITLVVIAPRLGVIEPLTTSQLLHIVIAVLFCAALLLGVSILTGRLVGRSQDEQNEEDNSTPVLGSPPYQSQLTKPRLPNRMYNDLRAPSQPAESTPRGQQPSRPASDSRAGGYPGYGNLTEFDENYDGRRYQPSHPGRPAGPRQSRPDSG
ncbi:MAG: hypothetical protein ACLQUY_15135, partial [Ktedonobacterales bacterium]